MANDDDAKETILELSGQTLHLKPHPTDLTVVGESRALARGAVARGAVVERRAVSRGVTRFSAKDTAERDDFLAAGREDSVVQPVYRVEGTDEEIIAGDRLELEMVGNDAAALQRIARQYHLTDEGMMGEAHVMRLTPQTGMGAIELAAQLQQRDDVAACRPQILLDQSPTPGLPRMPR